MSIELIIGGILTVLAGFVTAWFTGRATGKKDAITDKKVKDYERIIENAKARVDADHDASNGDAAERLRRDFSRDK